MADAAQAANPAPVSISVPASAPVPQAASAPVQAAPAPQQPQPAQPAQPTPTPAANQALPQGSIVAQTADGVQHVFPAGTPGNVIDGAIQTYVQQQAPGYKQALKQVQTGGLDTNAGGAVLGIENGLTFNNADRLNGAANAATQYVSNLLGGSQGQPSPRQMYDATRDAVNSEDQQFNAAHPYLSLASNIVGGLPLGGALVKGVAAAPTLAAKIAESIGAGTTAGFAYGAGANKSDPVSGAITGGAEGAVLGPVTLGLGNLAGRAAQVAKNSGVGQDVQKLVGRYLSGAPGNISQDAPIVASPSGPQPAGAQVTPASAPAMTQAEAGASQATAENYRLNSAVTGRVDPTIYVPGTKPTAAEIASDANVSQAQKLNQQAPGNQSVYEAQFNANNEAVHDYFDEAAGTPTLVNRMEEARDAQMNGELSSAFANKTDADATPVVDTIQSILSGRNGKRAVVQSALNDVSNRLVNSSGQLETDPELLYGVREHINDLLSKQAAQQTPLSARASSALMQVKNSLDSVIEPAAPGFGQAIKNYSQNSKPIDVANLLLEKKPSLTNGATRQFSFPKFDRFMKDTVSDRQAQGANAAKSIPDDVMDRLWNIHSHLARLQNLSLGNAKGSDTSMLTRAASLGAQGIAHTIAAHTAPLIGNILVHGATQGIEKRTASRVAERMLNPNVEKYLNADIPTTGKSSSTLPGIASTRSISVLPGAISGTQNLAQQYLQ